MDRKLWCFPNYSELGKLLDNKAPCGKPRGINGALQAAGLRQPAPRGAENLLGEIKQPMPLH
jgi:hypothetical protein